MIFIIIWNLFTSISSMISFNNFFIIIIIFIITYFIFFRFFLNDNIITGFINTFRRRRNFVFIFFISISNNFSLFISWLFLVIFNIIINFEIFFVIKTISFTIFVILVINIVGFNIYFFFFFI